MIVGSRSIPLEGGWARLLTLGVVDVRPAPNEKRPMPGVFAWTYWEKGSKTFQVYLADEALESLDTKTLQFLVRHEMAHIINGHFNWDECRGPDALIAADINVNYYLDRDNDIIRSIEGVIAEDFLKALNLEYQAYPLPILHEILHQKMKDSMPQAGGCGGISGVEDEEDMVEASTMALAGRGELSEEEKDAIGANPGNHSANRLVHAMSEARPEWAIKVADWARSVVELVQAQGRTNKRPSWSFKAYGLHVPTSKPTWAYKPDTVVMLVDTSGSMLDLVKQVGATIAYLNSHSIKVRVIAGDTRVLYDEEVSSAPQELPGGGGTDIVPLFERTLDYEPRGVVCFTDGYVMRWPDANKYSMPVLWVTDYPNVPFGESVPAK